MPHQTSHEPESFARVESSRISELSSHSKLCHPIREHSIGTKVSDSVSRVALLCDGLLTCQKESEAKKTSERRERFGAARRSLTRREGLTGWRAGCLDGLSAAAALTCLHAPLMFRAARWQCLLIPCRAPLTCHLLINTALCRSRYVCTV